MTLKRKGLKRITINETSYSYQERRGCHGYVIVKSGYPNGQKLVVTCDDLRPFVEYTFKSRGEDTLAVKRLSFGIGFSYSREVIRQAIFFGVSIGWAPEQKHKDLSINLNLLSDNIVTFAKT